MESIAQQLDTAESLAVEASTEVTHLMELVEVGSLQWIAARKLDHQLHQIIQILQGKGE